MGRLVFAIALLVSVLAAPARTGVLGDQAPDLAPDRLTDWTTVADYPLPLAGHGATTNGTYVYVTGGGTTQFNRYDPVANTWTPMAALPGPVRYTQPAYSAVNNKIYVIGGFVTACTGYLNQTLVYDVSTNAWTTGASMPAARFGHATIYYPPTGKIYVIGGWEHLGGCVIQQASQTWEYDPVANTWNTTRANVPSGMADSIASLVGQFIYVAGGSDNNAGTTFHYRYDIVNNVWTAMAPVPVPIRYGVGAAIGGETYIVGGGSTGVYNTTYVYNIVSNSWHLGPNTHVAHFGGTGIAFDRRIIVIGGNNGTNNTTTTEIAASTFEPFHSGLFIADAMAIGNAANNFGYLATNLVNYTFANSKLAANEFAIFQTHDPFGSTVVKSAITTASHTFTVFTPAQLPGFNFDAYRVVVLNFDDHLTSDFETPYYAAWNALNDYILHRRGVLWLQSSIKIDGGAGNNLITPLGGNEFSDPSNSDFVVDPISPLVAGAPNPITGNSASSGSFVDIPEGSHRIVTKTDANGFSTLFEVRLRRVPYDTNRDLMADRTVFRPSNGVWYTARSDGGATVTGWGTSTDIDVMGDYDGDGKADLAVFRPSSGLWFIVQSTNGSVRVASWGTSGDIPLTGDVDGDGRDDVVVYRPSAGTWFVLLANGSSYAIAWGQPGGSDVPLLGDYDGDATADVMVFRPSPGIWYIVKSGGGTTAVAFGAPGDIPLVGRYDHSASVFLVVFRPSTGQWWVTRSGGGTVAATWGMAGDIPISADFDGDDLDEFTIYRNGVWYSFNQWDESVVVGWGLPGDRPVGRTPGT